MCVDRVAGVADDAVPTLKLSEVAKPCGASVEVLRGLVEDGQLAGAVRSPNGHVYLRADAVPTWQEIVGLLENRLTHHIRRAQSALVRVRVEVEAVGNDLAEAIENPYEPLGDDLLAFGSFGGGGREESTLASALFRMERELWDVRLYGDALRKTRRVP